MGRSRNEDDDDDVKPGDRRVPEIIEVNFPGNRRVRLQCVALLVHSRDKDMRPKLNTIIHPGEKVDLHGSEDFVLAYVDKKLLQGLRK